MEFSDVSGYPLTVKNDTLLESKTWFFSWYSQLLLVW